MRAGAVAAAIIAALAVAETAHAADANIETVTVRRSTDDVLIFRIAFAEPVVLDGDTRVQVAIDADRDSSTGIDGLEYSLDWQRYVSLLTAVDGEPVESEPDSLRFEHDGAVVTFSIAAADVGSPHRFDFYTFIEQDGHTDIAPVHTFFSATWTYPEDDVATGGPYPTETYEDLNDDTIVEGDWGGLAWVGIGVGGLLALGAVVAIVGWSVERHLKRRRPAT